MYLLSQCQRTTIKVFNERMKEPDYVGSEQTSVVKLAAASLHMKYSHQPNSGPSQVLIAVGRKEFHGPDQVTATGRENEVSISCGLPYFGVHVRESSYPMQMLNSRPTAALLHCR